MNATGLRSFEPEPPDRQGPAVRGIEVTRWPIEVGCFVSCQKCGDRIVYDGFGSFGQLEKLLRRHIRSCSKRGPMAGLPHEGRPK